MHYVLLMFVWLIAITCLIFLIVSGVKRWFSRSRDRKRERRAQRFARLAERFRRRRQMDRPAPEPDFVDNIDFRRGLKTVGWIAFILWEAFWISEIAERFARDPHPLQLPYFFLLVVMVGVPVAVYYGVRKYVFVAPGAGASAP